MQFILLLDWSILIPSCNSEHEHTYIMNMSYCSKCSIWRGLYWIDSLPPPPPPPLSLSLSLSHSSTHQVIRRKKRVSASSMTKTQPMWKSSSMVSGLSRVSRVRPSCLTSHSDTRVTPIPIQVLVSTHSTSFSGLQR